nr:hypothetical protein [Streptomyces hawaiiensis]
MVGVARQGEGYIGDVEAADYGGVKPFGAPGAFDDGSLGPPSAELGGYGAQLGDEFGGLRVVGVAAGLGAQDADDLGGDLFPVEVQGAGGGVEEHPAQQVALVGRAVVERGEHRVEEVVGGQDLVAAAEDEGGLVVQSVQHAQQIGPHLLGRRLLRAAAGLGAQ